jgi:hypothetical protein
MPVVVALVVDPLQPLTSHVEDGSRGEFRDEFSIAIALAALGSLEDTGATLLLQADATVAATLAFSGLEVRPNVSLELEPREDEGGVRIKHVLAKSREGYVDDEMYRASLQGELTAAGLLDALPPDTSFASLITILKPSIALAVIPREPAPATTEAMYMLQRHAADQKCRLLVLESNDAWPEWQPVSQFLTPPQLDLVVKASSDDEIRDDEAAGEYFGRRRDIEQAAMRLARLTVAVERALIYEIGGEFTLGR